jgi:hypothetical protein
METFIFLYVQSKTVCSKNFFKEDSAALFCTLLCIALHILCPNKLFLILYIYITLNNVVLGGGGVKGKLWSSLWWHSMNQHKCLSIAKNNIGSDKYCNLHFKMNFFQAHRFLHCHHFVLFSSREMYQLTGTLDMFNFCAEP